jgi:2-polyprenyl-3-methyl-5-hydroxy-6-metoxy-1,4-benzoquinol methylase
LKREVLTANLLKPRSRLEITREFCRGKKVLDIGCVNHDIANVTAESWQHGALKEVASDILGLDYLESETAELAKRGFNVMAADVTKPLPTNETFDVIVIGHLIEHLSNFEGLMTNIQKHLNPGGAALISTPNPFFEEQYFYTAFRNDIVVNQEHTCWLDPVTLDHLAGRYGLTTTKVFWIKEKWRLEQIIARGGSRTYDIFTGKWELGGKPSILEHVISPLLEAAFLLAPKRLRTGKAGNADGAVRRRLLYLHFITAVFGVFWRFYKLFIVSSPVNRHEVFMSVVQRDDAAPAAGT